MRTWNNWLEEKRVKQGVCLFLLLIVHLDAFISVPYLSIIVCLAFFGFYLRIRTDGMLAPYLTHVIADLVIGFYLCFQVFEVIT